MLDFFRVILNDRRWIRNVYKVLRGRKCDLGRLFLVKLLCKYKDNRIIVLKFKYLREVINSKIY